MSAEELVPAERTSTAVETMSCGVFVSYSRRDQTFVRRLDERLDQAGRRVWVDWQDIPPSASWRAEIYSAIEAMEVFIFVMSPASLSSTICREEVSHAFAMNKRVVPVAIGDIDPTDVPSDLGALNWLLFGEADDFETSFATLLTALDTDLEWVKAHTRLMVRALEWEARTDRSLLLRGADLEAAERWLALRPAKPEPTATQSQYVLASRRARTSRQRSVVVVSLAAVVIMLLLALAAWVQRDQAREQARAARAGQLAAEASSQVQVDDLAALSLASAAVNLKPTIEAQEVFRRAMESPLRAALRHSQPVRSADFSPDGRLVVSAGDDGRIRVWDWSKADPPEMLDQGGIVSTVEFSSDGRLVISSGEKGVWVWDRAEGKVLKRLGDPDDPSAQYFASAAFSPDDRHVVIRGAEGAVHLWDWATAGVRDVDPYPSSQISVQAVTFSPDGRRVASAGGDGTVRVWEWANRSVATILKVGGSVSSAAFSPDGRLVVSGGSDGKVRVWDWASQDEPKVLDHLGLVSAAAFSADGRLVVSSGEDGKVRVWDWASGRQLTMLNHGGLVSSASFSPDGRHVVSAGRDGTVRVWEWASTGAPRVLDHGNVVNSAAFSLDGRLVVSAGNDGKVRVWNWESGEVLKALDHGQAAASARFSSDGHLVVSAGPVNIHGGMDAYGKVAVWDWASGEAPKVFAPRIPVYSASFSRDDRLVVTAGAYEGIAGTAPGVYEWEWAGSDLPSAILPAASSAAFSPDGKLVVSTSRVQSGGSTIDTVQLRNRADGTTRILPRAAPATNVEFSRDGHLVVSAGKDGKVRVWDLANGGDPKVLDQGGSVTSASFSPDGSQVVSAGSDGKVRVWDWTGMTAPKVFVQGGTVSSAAFSPDGSRVVSGGGDGKVRIWQCLGCGPLDDLLATAKGRLARPTVANGVSRQPGANGGPITMLGRGPYGSRGDGGPALEADLSSPSGVGLAGDGSVYIADGGNSRVRRVGPDGVISTVAGSGEEGFGGDGGPAVEAQLSSPSGVAVAGDGSVYIADGGNSRVRRVGPDGVISTVAGIGEDGFGGDGGPAVKAQLSSPSGVAVGSDGRIYIADAGNSRIRRLDPGGVISTMAGSSRAGSDQDRFGKDGFSGDGGSALTAGLASPGDIAVAGDGSVYIADGGNSRIRRVSPAGVITTVAGR